MKSNVLLNGKAGPDSKTYAYVCTRECGHFQTPFWPSFILNVHWTKTFDWTILSSTSILFLKYILILSLIQETKTLQETEVLIWWGTDQRKPGEVQWVTGISMKSTFWKVLYSPENTTKTIPFCFLSAQILKNLTSLINIWSLHSIQLHFVFFKKRCLKMFLFWYFLTFHPPHPPTVFGIRVVHV